MKKHLLTVAGICMFLLSNAQIIPIPNGTYGQNANLTDTIGTNLTAGGKLNLYWNRATSGQNYVQQSRVYYMRYGGIQVETDCKLGGNPNTGMPTPSDIWLTIHDYIRKAVIMQNDNIEPMLTLPLNLTGVLTTIGQNATAVATLVERVNDSLKAMGRPVVKYWIYSNEPEDGGGLHVYDDSLAAQKIFNYIQAYYNAVTPVWNANTTAWGVTPADLKFVGPELYGYDNYNHGSGKVNRLIEQLTGQYTPYGNFSIVPYISVFSYHLYSFNTEADSTIGIPKPTRANVVNALKLGAPKVGGGSSSPMLTDINQLKGWLPSTVGVAITEANICHKDDVNPSDGYNITDDAITGNGANSFIGGQFWAEMMSYAMEGQLTTLNFWSGLEGCGTGCTDSLYKTNVGYLNSDPSKFGGLGGKKPSYYHFKMLSDNFHGNFHRGNYFHNSATPPPTFTNGNGIKTFASVEPAGIKVMILNQNDSAYKFRINFNGSTVVGTDTIRLQFPNISSDPNISSTIQPNHLYYPTPTDTAYKKIAGRSTALLTFDCNGIFQYRQDYSEADATINNPPHFVMIGNTPVDPSFLAQSLISCGHPGIGGTINSNTTYSNTTVYVNSNILITGASELKFVNCLVVMAAGTKIKANPNCSIVLNKSIMVGCGGNTWKGLELNGNYHAGERFKMDSSYIFNATNPVYADKIGDMHIFKSVFANGVIAVELNRSQAFSITENIFVGYNTGIKTTNTKPNYVSVIKDNRMIELETAIKFADDAHNMLDVFCNDLLYRQKGIETSNTDLKIQGTSSMSAGNRFIKITPGAPLDYVDHSGTPTQYYYGPSETAEFSLPFIVNIPIVMAAADRTCKIAFNAVCAPWAVGIEENTKPITPGMLVYPNPSQGQFTVNLSNLPKGNWNLTVYDVMGRLISTRKVDASTENTILQINSKGMYFVSLQSGNNRITQKVIVE